jgi:phosphonate transport system ATP-binding protein
MIKMDKVTLGYKKEKILKKVSFEVKDGEFIGIIGPSGAGKSTLLMSVVGGIKVFDGKFEVLGFDMDNIKKKHLVKLREQVGIIFQGYNLVDRLSVLDNVASGMLKDIPMARAVIKYYKDRELKKIHELMDVVDVTKHSLKRCDELSGGQRQRVAIARALASDPKIILADEPISALDQKSATKVMKILETVNKDFNVTILANLHHLEVATKYCTRIIGVNDGNIIFDGKPSQLSEKIIDKIYDGADSSNEEN